MSAHFRQKQSFDPVVLSHTLNFPSGLVSMANSAFILGNRVAEALVSPLFERNMAIPYGFQAIKCLQFRTFFALKGRVFW
jgi:hypothetical protein